MAAFDTEWWDARCLVDGKVDTDGVPHEGAHHVTWTRWRLIDDLLARFYTDFGLEPGFGLIGSELYNVVLHSPTCRRAPRDFGRHCGGEAHPMDAMSPLDGLAPARTGTTDLSPPGPFESWSAYLESTITALGLTSGGVVGHEGCFHRRGKALTHLTYRIALLLRTGGRAAITDDDRMLTLTHQGNGRLADFDHVNRMVLDAGSSIPAGPPRFIAVDLGGSQWVALRTDGWVATANGPVEAGALWRSGRSIEQVVDAVRAIAQTGG